MKLFVIFVGLTNFCTNAIMNISSVQSSQNSHYNSNHNLEINLNYLYLLLTVLFINQTLISVGVWKVFSMINLKVSNLPNISSPKLVTF